LATKYNAAPEKSIPWPEKWNDIKSASTIKHSDYFYSIYLDKQYLADYIRFAEGRKKGQAVEINGEKYYVSYRIPFPNIK
jgi:hypothetical protein